MKLIKITDNLQVWQATKPSRAVSFIADIDLAEYCPEFWHKCFDVLHGGQWAYSQKAFVISIMQFYDDWSYISWKQYDSVMDLWISPKQTAKELRSKNINYVVQRGIDLSKAGWKSFQNFSRETWIEHCLEDDVDEFMVGRYLPTDEMLENMWCDLATAIYPEAAPMARALGLHW